MITTDNQLAGTIERSADGATLRFERSYDKPRDVVWAALTEPAQLGQWLDRASVDLRLGGAFIVYFGDATMNGRITDLDPQRVLAYSWHEGQEGESHVRWDLEDRPGGGTNLRITHVRLRHESASGFAAGWHHHLERMEGVLTGGSIEWHDDRFGELRKMYEAGAA